MKILKYAAYQPEQNLSPRIVFAVILMADILFVFAVQILNLSQAKFDSGMQIYLLLFGYAAAGLLLDRYSRMLARWYAFVGMLAVVMVLAAWFHTPELLFLIPIVVALAGSMTNLPSAAAAAGIASFAILVYNRWIAPEMPPSLLALAFFACWAMLAVLASIYLPINQHALWMNEHFETSAGMLREARNRKAELEQALEGLANANRQLALANQKMAVLSKIAEDAQQAKSMFVVNVSHEFRTPLNMIIGLIDLMIRTPENYDVVLSPKMREDFAVISRNCEHLSNMVSDVLDLTRVETGRLVLYREWVDLRDIIEKGIQVVRPLLDKKHLQMSLDIAEGMPNIYCDRIRIQQVILNLLSNAARFTDKGGISLLVTYKASQVTVQVTDTGPGIQVEDRERIFEPFWQGRDPMWQKKGGSGIGLSLSREFVTMHGGHMWFESELRQGTSFFFMLPISPVVEPLGRAGHQIKDDWVWKEDAFRSAQVSTTAQILKPRVIIYDETDTLYPRFAHYSDKVEFVNISDVEQFGREGMAKAFILNAPTIEKLWPMVQSAANGATSTAVIGCSVPGEFRRALETGATGYLVKPIRMDDFKRILDAQTRPVREVLILDDDPEVLGLYQRMLLTIDASLHVRTLSSGAEAIQEVARQEPDLMFLDIVMPDMNGWQVLETISREMGPKRFPIYFITAQDPVDHLMSGFVLATIKGGVSMGKLIHASLEIASLLSGSEQEPEPTRDLPLESGMAAG